MTRVQLPPSDEQLVEEHHQPSASELTSREEALSAVLRRRGRDGGFVVVLYAASIAVALLLSAALVALTGGSPGRVAGALLDGAIRQPGAWGRTLSASAPLMIVAVGAVLANRAGMVNIGQEGQLAIGAAFASFAAVNVAAPGRVPLVVALLAGALGGALWAGIAAGLRFWRQVPEVITTLLLVFVAFQVVNYGLTRGWLLRDNDPDRVQHLNTGPLLPTGGRLPVISLFGNQFHAGVVVGLIVVAVLGLLLVRTVWGFRLRMLGLNPIAARRAGVSHLLVGGGALALSGALAGLGGAVLLAGGPAHRLSAGFSGNVGWNGLLVALIARDRPALVVPIALVFGAFRTGAGFLAATGVARTIVDVVQALLVLALLLPPVYLAIRDRRRALAAARSRT